MKELFVPYELALLAKEKGFNKRCLGVYNDTNEEKIKFSIDSDGIRNDDILGGHHNIQGFSHTTAPLYQQLVDWFREKHEIHIYITPSYFGEDSLEKHPGYGYNIKRLFIKFRGRYTSTSKYSFKEINDKLIDINGMLLKGSDNYLNTLSIALENAFKLI